MMSDKGVRYFLRYPRNSPGLIPIDYHLFAALDRQITEKQYDDVDNFKSKQSKYFFCKDLNSLQTVSGK